MKKQEMIREYKEALAKFMEPIMFAANETRTVLGLPPVDVTTRPEIVHQIAYFKNGFYEGAAGYYDKWYEDRNAYKAYLAGNYAGREFCKGEFQAIG